MCCVCAYRFAHAVAICCGFAGLEISAACNAVTSSNLISFLSILAWFANFSPARLDLNFVRCSKWARMSVPNTIC